MMMLASGAVLPALPVQADSDATAYKLNLSTGKFPKDVAAANVNGVLPRMSAYKRGYTEAGWTVDRLYGYGYVAVTPTYTAGEGSCENTLTLPALKIEKDYTLSWSAQSVYRHFPESYRVEALPAGGGDPVVLADVDAESYFAVSREVPLDAFEGQEVALRFVCTSGEGYLLAIWNLQVGVAQEDEHPADNEAAGGSEDPFTRRFLIDRGTGMWCVNCPAGDVAVEQLLELYGDRVVTVNTHVNDVLGNQPYWNDLKWYAVPYMMINRIQASAGSGTGKFTPYYDQPTFFAINLDKIPDPDGRTIDITAHVRVAEATDNADGHYRVGYVVTGDFHDPSNPDFLQKNNCSQPSYGPYYYLPSSILPELMYYEDVSLTSDAAFTGIADSLPASMEEENDYEVRWQVEVPGLLEDAAGARVVAYVLDTTTGEVLNVDALHVGENPTVGVDMAPAADSLMQLDATCDGVCIRLSAGEAYRLDIYSMAGALIDSYAGISRGCDIVVPYSVAPGMYVATLSTAHGHKGCKIVVR